MNATQTPSRTHKIINWIITALLCLFILIALCWGIYTYYRLDHDLYTNDAQVEEYITPVNTRITGYIKAVRFNDHQRIKKGDTLVIIDDREFRIAVEQAEAGWLSARASKGVTASAVSAVHSGQEVTEANIRALNAQIWNAEQNFHRYENLLKADAATQQEFDQVKTQYTALTEQKNALLRQQHTTDLNTTETNRRMPVNDAEIKRAQAALDMSNLNLSYTIITAPYDGVTGRRTIQEGQAVTAGQNLLSFVRSDSKWVVANYKETQVTHLRIGEKMMLTVDGIEDRKYEGKIEAISEATGSRYSAIPVDNSTGNFVKVQQRIPVRIEFSGVAPVDLERFIAGMNVEVHIANTK